MSFAPPRPEANRPSSRRPPVNTSQTRPTRPVATEPVSGASSSKPISNASARPHPLHSSTSPPSNNAPAHSPSITTTTRPSLERPPGPRARTASTPSKRPVTAPSPTSGAFPSREPPISSITRDPPVQSNTRDRLPSSASFSSNRLHPDPKTKSQERPRTADSRVDSTATRNFRYPESLSASTQAAPASSTSTPRYSGQSAAQKTSSSVKHPLSIPENTQANHSGTRNVAQAPAIHPSAASATKPGHPGQKPIHPKTSIGSLSQKTSSPDLRSTYSKSIRPTLSTEAFPTSRRPSPSTRTFSHQSGHAPRSPEHDSSGPADPSPGSLSPPATSQGPTPQRTPSTSISSASTSQWNASDVSRSPGMLSSPALDGIPHRLAIDDMKRLLSKPASIMSGSDSEGYRSMGPPNAAQRRRTMVSSDDDMGGGGYRSSPGRISSAFVKSRFAQRDSGLNSDAEEDQPSPKVGPTLPLPTTVKRSPSAEKRRNVLKRRPSNGKEQNLSIFPASYTESKMKGTGSSSNSKSRSVSMSPLPRQRDSAPSDTSALTPASALVMAYKQQQEAQEKKLSGEIERAQSGSDSSTKTTSPRDPARHTATPAAPPLTPDEPSPANTTPPSTPYYTIFGSKSGKVVAVGGPEDSWSEFSLGSGFAAGLGAGLGIDTEKATSVTAGKPRLTRPSSSGLGKTLTRKMSGRWRKGSFAAEEIEWERVEPPSAKSMERERERQKDFERERVTQSYTEPERGRMSLQERRGNHRKPVPVSGDEVARSLHVSIDAHAIPIEPPTPLKTPLSGGGAVTTPKFDENFSFNSSPRSRKSEPAGGSKLWKLMKRISTGGLRDKFVDDSPDEPPPPVPAIPKDYLSMAGGPRSMDGHASAQNPGLMSRFAQTRSSLSQPRPSLSTVTVRPTTGSSSLSSGGPRPSTTTRSSSPGSSDVASSKFFNRAQSQRSSSSSYGEEVPPMPNTLVGQPIIPPNELYKLTMSISIQGDTRSKLVKPSHRTKRSISSPEKWARPSGMGIETPTLPSLPVPPSQRRVKKDIKDPSRPPSPTIPEFSTDAPINTFPSRKSISTSPDPDCTRPLSPPPPPRPSRSPHRPSPSTSTASSRVTSPLPSPPPLPIVTSSNSLDLRRTSTASHATARPKSYASTFGPPTTPLTAQFRDKPPPKQTWTEQEKADMWDDLLERSARAGGTLHLKGDEGLASDQLRFSAVSTEVDSEAE